MHDIKWIREHPDDFDRGLKRRGLAARAAQLIALDAEKRDIQTEIQEMQTRRNAVSKEIGKARQTGADAGELIQEMGILKAGMADGEARLKALSDSLQAQLLEIPNLPAADVPDGADEAANAELRRIGEIPSFGFPVKAHDDLGVALGGLDFAAAAHLSGARFVVMRGAIARLSRALAQFMLDLHTGEHGYTEVNLPLLVHDDALIGTGQLPKFAEDLFRVQPDFWLIPTAEVPLTNLAAAGGLLEQGDLPLRMTAFSPCFRSEAGAAGRDTRGMIRMHQFEKVELVSIVPPDDSDAELERMTACAEEVLKRLDLPYRVMSLCTGDLGFAARKTYDLEVYLPGQGLYREISSCSNTGDFQARRMNARFRPRGQEKGTAFVHTLNGSGLAVGRTLVAVLENYQQADGSIAVPAALKPYMAGIEAIGADV